MADGTSGVEVGSAHADFTPQVTILGSRKDSSDNPFPSDFRQRFKTSVAPVYPQNSIQHMISDGYNPTIIGYTHANPIEFEQVTRKLSEIKSQNPGKALRAVQEIDLQQLQWIKDFVGVEAEYMSKGTVRGKPGRPDELQRMRAYRDRLRTNLGEGLSLWFLDNGIAVQSIEHQDVLKWIEADKTVDLSDDDEETFSSSRGVNLQPFYTAIRRDVHGATLIDDQRPAIISVGAMHALKYDMLLNRDGSRSFYYLNRPFDWNTIAKHWEATHTRYAEANRSE